MIFVLIRPQTLAQKLNFYFRGIVPSIACSQINCGPGLIECVNGNTAEAIPTWSLLKIIWDDCYQSEVARARTEFMANLAAKARLRDCGGCEETDPGEDYNEAGGPTPGLQGYQ